MELQDHLQQHLQHVEEQYMLKKKVMKTVGPIRTYYEVFQKSRPRRPRCTSSTRWPTSAEPPHLRRPRGGPASRQSFSKKNEGFNNIIVIISFININKCTI